MDESKHLKNIQTMTATIRSFSFLIKQRSLFYELMDEIKLSSELTPDELICRIIKMFGGLEISIPSVNELKLYQYLLNNAKDYYSILLHKTKDPWKAVEHKIKSEYQESLVDVDLKQIVVGFVDTLADLNFDTKKEKLDRKWYLAGKKYHMRQSGYKRFLKNGTDDTPEDDSIEDEEE